MAIKQIINAQVLGARFVQVDGRNYASIFLIEDNENENDVGMVPLKLAVDPAKFLEVKSAISDAGAVPVALSLETVMKPASGGGMKMEVVGVVKSNPTPAQRAKEAALSGKAPATA